MTDKEEMERLLPVLKRVRREVAVPLSIDTVRPEVARKCLDAGADIIRVSCPDEASTAAFREIARAATIKAQQLLDAGSDKAELMVSVAKAKAGKAAGLAVKEGVQMHGGIGMTDEYDIGLYMKRDRALAEFMGDVYYHAERVAQLTGY